MIKNYDPNIRVGTHTVKVTLGQWDYKGEVWYEMGGNTKGSAIMLEANRG